MVYIVLHARMDGTLRITSIATRIGLGIGAHIIRAVRIYLIYSVRYNELKWILSNIF